MKTKEELNALKEEAETVSEKLHELTDGELTQVVGGARPRPGYQPCSKMNITHVDSYDCYYGPSGSCEYLCRNGNVCTCGEDASRGSFTLPNEDPIEITCSNPNAAPKP